MTASKNVPMKKIEVPRDCYPLDYSSRLVRTSDYFQENRDKPYFSDGHDPDFYDTLKVAAEMAVAAGKNITLSDAGEEQQIYVQKSPGAKKLRDVEEFMDYFANNNGNWYAWEHSLTALRFRENDLNRDYRIGEKIKSEIILTKIPEDILRQIADEKFTHDNFKDIINKINKMVDSVDVPYSRGHVIKEMHSTLGIFTEVEKTTEHEAPHALHAWMRNNLQIPKDLISGHYDVAVGRGCSWHLGVGEGCLNVDAGYGRSVAGSDVGFRPVVRGS
jgi:hypothetical protein